MLSGATKSSTMAFNRETFDSSSGETGLKFENQYEKILNYTEDFCRFLFTEFKQWKVRKRTN